MSKQSINTNGEMPSAIPTLAEFLAWSISDIASGLSVADTCSGDTSAGKRSIVPASMVYAPGGTRRSAVFHGIKPWTPEYVEWGWLETLRCVDLIFRFGVEHVFLPLIMSGHVREYGGDATHLMQMLTRFLTNAKMLDKVAEFGWRVRLVNFDDLPDLERASRAFEAATSDGSQQVLWLMTTTDPESHWRAVFQNARQGKFATREQAICAMYGEYVPLISLYLGFGKPTVNPELFPPLLQGDIQCYWSQQAGYSLTEKQLRMILYDYAFLRQTWQQDKTSRAAQAEADQALWESEFILGLGRRIGPFWYPDMQGYPTDVLTEERAV